MNSRGWRFAFLVLVVMSASCSGKGDSTKGGATSAPGTETGITADATGAQRAQVKDVGSLVDLIVAEAAELPRAEFDPDALAGSLQNDPQKIFEWVRDRTWWAPYRGLLRGAKGVMLDRVGSSLDRAVLLGDLLRRSGYTVRLAHTQLSETRARELLERLQPIPDQRRNPIQPIQVSAERQHAIEAILPGIDETIHAQIARSKQLSEEAKSLVRSRSDQLLAIVGDVATRSVADEEEAIAALQDHWWVEREGNGTWIAMDVLLPDASIGNTLATASTTSDWKAAADAPSIPDLDWHMVQIRVVIERYQGGTTTESTALETVLRPAEVLERPIVLIHLPKPWPTEIPDSKTDPNALKNAALWVNEWVPILQVGDDLIAQSAYTDSGDLTSMPKDSAAGLGGATSGGLDFFGSSLGGDEEAESFATAEWIDYEIRVPGKPAQRLRRPVFDLLGPARRATHTTDFEANTDALKLERFEALWSRTDILLQSCDFTSEFVTHLMTASIIANQAEFTKLSQERDPATARTLASTILDRIHNWGPLPDFVLWRSALGNKPGDWFLDRPNVLNYRIGRLVVDADRVAVREMIDIASNAIGVRRGASRTSFEVRLRQGVTDTVAEMLTLESDLQLAENTASVFAMAPSGPDHGVLIKPRDAAAVQELNWPADAAARLTEITNAGFMAVAPKEPVMLRERQRVGWWRVDPVSGETIGVMDTGFHADTAEYNAALARKNRLFTWLYEKDRYRDWQTLKLMAEGGFRMTPQQAYNLRLFNLTQKVIENIQFFVL